MCSRVVEEGNEKPLVETREEKRKRRATATTAIESKRTRDPGLGLDFVGLRNAIAVSETRKEEEEGTN